MKNLELIRQLQQPFVMDHQTNLLYTIAIHPYPNQSMSNHHEGKHNIMSIAWKFARNYLRWWHTSRHLFSQIPRAKCCELFWTCYKLACLFPPPRRIFAFYIQELDSKENMNNIFQCTKWSKNFLNLTWLLPIASCENARRLANCWAHELHRKFNPRGVPPRADCRIVEVNFF
jgi:hypothetical protein